MAKRKPDGNSTRQPVAEPAPVAKDFPAGKFHLLACALILGAALLAYHNSFTDAFVFDDMSSILDNPYVSHLWPLSEALKAPPDTTPAGRPVLALSLAVNYALGGLNVFGYHVFNLAVHGLAALVLFGVVRRTLSGERLRPRFGTTADGLALAVALLWVVHPLQTESVTYIVQRAESLMGLFYLLTLYCFIRGVESGASRIWHIFSVAACALGMACKEAMVSAPLVVLLYDQTFLSGTFREALRRRWPVYLALSSTWILLGYLVASASIIALKAAARPELTWWAYALTEPGVILHYLRLAIWPDPLCLDYQWPMAKAWTTIVLPAVVVAALLGSTVWACQRKSGWGFLGAWFFLILAPTSSVIPLSDLAFEHRMYLPLAAVVTLVVLGVFRLVERVAGNGQKFSRILVWGVGGLAVVLLTAATIRRNLDYRSELIIWQDTVEKRPHNPRAHYNLGFVLEDQGKLPEAITHYQQAVRIKPDYADAHNNLGFTLARVGKVEDAMGHFERALQIAPDDALAHCNMGNVLARVGRLQDAIGHFEQALRIKPDFAEAHYDLGLALAQTGRVREAIGHYEQALRIKPDFTQAQNALARLQAGQ